MTKRSETTFTEGQQIKFRATAATTGPMTVQSRKRTVTLKKDGVPVKAGDIQPGQVVSFDWVTGEIQEP